MPSPRSRPTLLLTTLLTAGLSAALALTSVPVAGAAGPTSTASTANEPPTPTPPPTPAPGPRAGTVTLAAPARVVDERAITLTATWRFADGTPVAGGTVVFEQRSGAGWRALQRRTTGKDGRARLETRPRSDSTWRARGLADARAAASTSRTAFVDNVPPPAPPVVLGGPAPRSLPLQVRAPKPGAQAVVSRIPAKVWRSMVGRSWRAGCPVGRSSLRLVRVNYYGFDGYRYRGEIVVHQAIARRTAAAFSEMHARQLPIRRMYRVDRFGYSTRLKGADDYASMATDNTSGFNCRDVVGRPGRRSPHASGRSIDINPWENPFLASHGWTPNSYWVGRSHPRVAWRSTSHPVLQVWRRHGFRWTYGTSDAHHLDGRQAARAVLDGGFSG